MLFKVRLFFPDYCEFGCVSWGLHLVDRSNLETRSKDYARLKRGLLFRVFCVTLNPKTTALFDMEYCGFLGKRMIPRGPPVERGNRA